MFIENLPYFNKEELKTKTIMNETITSKEENKIESKKEVPAQSEDSPKFKELNISSIYGVELIFDREMTFPQDLMNRSENYL